MNYFCDVICYLCGVTWNDLCRSRTKLAEAKSRGLVRTLISEALTSQKTWEEIKDSLHLKFQMQTFTHQLATLWTSNNQANNL